MSEHVPSHYQKLKNDYPEFFKAVENLGETARKSGPLDEKTGHLLQLAASVANKNEGAVHSHTRQLAQLGATAGEIRHAVILLSSTIGFPTVMAGLSWVNDILHSREE